MKWRDLVRSNPATRLYIALDELEEAVIDVAPPWARELIEDYTLYDERGTPGGVEFAIVVPARVTTIYRIRLAWLDDDAQFEMGQLTIEDGRVVSTTLYVSDLRVLGPDYEYAVRRVAGAVQHLLVRVGDPRVILRMVPSMSWRLRAAITRRGKVMWILLMREPHPEREHIWLPVAAIPPDRDIVVPPPSLEDVRLLDVELGASL